MKSFYRVKSFYMSDYMAGVFSTQLHETRTSRSFMKLFVTKPVGDTQRVVTWRALRGERSR